MSNGVYQHLGVRQYDILCPCLNARYATFVWQPCMSLLSDISARTHFAVTNAAAVVKWTCMICRRLPGM